MKVSIQYVDGSIDYFNGSNAKKVHEAFIKARTGGYTWFKVETVEAKESFSEDKEIYVQMRNIISVVKE